MLNPFANGFCKRVQNAVRGHSVNSRLWGNVFWGGFMIWWATDLFMHVGCKSNGIFSFELYIYIYIYIYIYLYIYISLYIYTHTIPILVRSIQINSIHQDPVCHDRRQDRSPVVARSHGVAGIRLPFGLMGSEPSQKSLLLGNIIPSFKLGKTTMCVYIYIYCFQYLYVNIISNTF